MDVEKGKRRLTAFLQLTGDPFLAVDELLGVGLGHLWGRGPSMRFKGMLTVVR